MRFLAKSFLYSLLFFFSSFVVCYEKWTPARNQWGKREGKEGLPVPDFSEHDKKVLRSGFNDMNDLVLNVLDFHDDPNSDQNKRFDFDTIFKKWFPIEQKTNVIKLFKKFVEIDPASEKFPLNYFSMWKANEEEDKSYCISDDPIIAHVVNPWTDPENRGTIDTNTGHSNIYFCYDQGINDIRRFPFLDDLSCPNSGGKRDIEKWVSRKMTTLGFFLLHEATHLWRMSYLVFGQNPATDNIIGDVLIDSLQYDNKPLPKYTRAFGPILGQLLAASPTLQNQAQWNADSYAWFATEVFFTLQCQMYFDRPKSNENTPDEIPPNESDDDDDDDSDYDCDEF